jgi:hypothetical protein
MTEVRVGPSLAALTYVSVLAGCASMPASQPISSPCDRFLAEASVHTTDFAGSSVAQAAAAHSSYAASMARYHKCLADGALRQAP